MKILGETKDRIVTEDGIQLKLKEIKHTYKRLPRRKIYVEGTTERERLKNAQKKTDNLIAGGYSPVLQTQNFHMVANKNEIVKVMKWDSRKSMKS